MNIYQKVSKARLQLQGLDLKKSGHNKFAGFKYYELSDILPHVNRIFDELGLFASFNIQDELATLTLVDSDKPESMIEFTSPIADAQVKGTTPVQSLGAVHTYLKRYLYVNALEIVEHDVLDSQVGNNTLTETLATDKQVEIILDKLPQERLVKMLTHYGVESVDKLTTTQASEVIKRVR